MDNHIKDGCKLPYPLESPLNVYLCQPLAGILLPVCNQYKITPNQVTFMNIFVTLLSIFSICQGWFVTAGITWFFTYILDCADGMLARTTNQVTVFGDRADHMRDNLGFGAIFIAVLYYCPMNWFWIFLQCLSIAGTAIYTGFSEEYLTHAQPHAKSEIDIESHFLVYCQAFTYFLSPARKYPQRKSDPEQSRLYLKELVDIMQITKWMSDVNINAVLITYLLTL